MTTPDKCHCPNGAEQPEPEKVGEAEVLKSIYGDIDEDDATYWWPGRVQLLPQNRWFLEKVRETRLVLGLPEHGISVLDLRCFPDRDGLLKDTNYISRTSLAEYWMQVHEAKANGMPIPKRILPPGFPAWFKDYLISKSVLSAKKSELPMWMQRTPDVPPGQGYDDKIPLDRYTALLVEAFRLPWGLFPGLRFYVLTNDEQALEWEGPLDVEITGVRPWSRQTLRVTVSGVDAWTTKEKWIDLYDKHISPMQDRQRQVLGSWPSHRRSTWMPDAGALLFYKLVEHDHWTWDQAINKIQGWEEVGHSTVSHRLKVMNRLLKPLF